MIYMDNAATTMQKPKEVTDAVLQAMNSMGNAGEARTALRWMLLGRFTVQEIFWQNFLVRKVRNRLCLQIILQKV